MSVKNIIKRNGDVVKFNPDLILCAIKKALIASGESCNKLACLVDEIVDNLSIFNKSFGNVSVENCQDEVEKSLMRASLHKTARMYVIYRENRNISRVKNELDSKSNERGERNDFLAKEEMKHFKSSFAALVAKRTYNAWLPKEGRREFWQETITRVSQDIKKRCNGSFTQDEIDEIHNSILNMEVMPSMRVMQFAGSALDNNLRSYNCCFIAPTSLEDFRDMMYILMCGTGVGFSVEKVFVDRLPPIVKNNNNIEKFVIGDSKEGWCDAFYAGLKAWWSGSDIDFDFSKIRPVGSRLSSGGRASGPEPLKNLFNHCRQIILKSPHDRLKPINVHSIVCFIGKIVVVGGVRRCLARGSKVHMSDGSLKNIEDVKIGDSVYSAMGKNLVSDFFVQGEQEIMEFSYGEDQKILCTKNHRIAIFVSNKTFSWKTAIEVDPNFDSFVSAKKGNFSEVKINSVKHLGEKLETFDIEVENEHNFMCDGILVHNSALISLSDLDDVEMRDCKSGAFYVKNDHYCLANNSAVYNEEPDDVTFMQEWLALAKSGSGERGIFSRSHLSDILPKRRVDLLGDRIKELGSNPCCVSGDTWIKTEKGDKQVKDLIGTELKFNVNGVAVPTIRGFYKTGNKQVFEIVVTNGNSVKVTCDHKFMKLETGWVKLEDLKIGDEICLANEEYSNIFHYSSITSITPLGFEDVYDVNMNSDIIKEFNGNGFRLHNCEIFLQSRGFCNLTSVTCSNDDTFESLKRKIRIATMIGTYQSSLTNFTYIQDSFKRIAEEERLLGVSFSNIACCETVRNAEVLKQLRDYTIEVNKEYAKRFNINESSCITAIKPEGTSSCVTSSCSGIHPGYSKYFLRRVRISTTDPLCNFLKKENVPYFPENGTSFEAGNVTTLVFEFPLKSPKGAVLRNEISAIDMFNWWKLFKTNYAEHNVSITISVKPNEWFELGNEVKKNWPIIGGISFLPYSDMVYTLAPFEEIDREEYRRRKNDIGSMDFGNLWKFESEDETDGLATSSCEGGLCTREKKH